VVLDRIKKWMKDHLQKLCAALLYIFLFHMEALADKTGKIELHTQKMALP